jgi:hypothetical protein
MENESMSNKRLLNEAIERALHKHGEQYGKKKDDYYGLIFFERVLRIQEHLALDQLSFGNHDLGIDGFHFDEETGAFRIFQFKNSAATSLFNESLQCLIEKGLPALFGDQVAVPMHQPIVDATRRSLSTNKHSISEVFVDFVFRGEASEAENSRSISGLRAQLVDEQEWRVDQYFNDRVPLAVRFLVFDGFDNDPPLRDSFQLQFRKGSAVAGPDSLEMYVGFVKLSELNGIRRALGRKFLQRNIRYALPPDGHVNRALASTFASILLKKEEVPELFAFHHNGITLSAQALKDDGDGEVTLYAPRLLNGAQTLATFSDFWDRNGSALGGSDAKDLLSRLLVPCRVIVGASSDAVTEIAVNNNRQNPVQAWQLHANDQIQLEIEDWLRAIGIPYQRQDRAFAKVSAEEWQDMDYSETRPIELVRFARTFLAAEGELGKLSRIGDVFESRKEYADLFGRHRLNADLRFVLICYKVQFHLPKLVERIRSRGQVRYDFIGRYRDIVWALVCQAVLNDPQAEQMAVEYGSNLASPRKFTDRILELASTRVRPLIGGLLDDEEYRPKVEALSYSFMRSSRAFDKAMNSAGKLWAWRKFKLR